MLALARLLWFATNSKANAGWCPICEKKSFFIEERPWLRDNYRCFRCRSIPRNRALMLVLSRLVPEYRAMHIHESSPAGAVSDKLAKECPNYLQTHYFQDTPPGAVKNGIRCENLERMTFPDERFDVIVTQDVLEHVMNPDKAFAEIARTLRPGGVHIFTVPYYPSGKTRLRARETSLGIEYLAEKEFHGNPIDSEGSLVISDWGNDFADYILRCSGLATEIFHLTDRTMGIDGEFLEVFVSRKPDIGHELSA